MCILINYNFKIYRTIDICLRRLVKNESPYMFKTLKNADSTQCTVYNESIFDNVV